MQDLEQTIAQAAEAISQAKALLIGAGAGMGVDSGMPDFRGDQGFWKAYPAFRGKQFSEMSNPFWFAHDPEQAWGFFGHRYNLYSGTQPHAGFAFLHEWAAKMPSGAGVFTSNVDGHFQKAGFASIEDLSIAECHGSIHFLQCSEACPEIWPAKDLDIEVDMETVRATSPLPRCPTCDAVARPNILMFGDYGWLQERTARQEHALQSWLNQVSSEDLVVVELGAGTAIPTVRYECERHGGTLIRINPRDPDVPEGGLSIPLGALAALQKIASAMG